MRARGLRSRARDAKGKEEDAAEEQALSHRRFTRWGALTTIPAFLPGES